MTPERQVSWPLHLTRRGLYGRRTSSVRVLSVVASSPALHTATWQHVVSGQSACEFPQHSRQDPLDKKKSKEMKKAAMVVCALGIIGRSSSCA